MGALVWQHSRGQLVLGSSNGIRDVDLAGAPAAEPAATVFANRGLAGIDGTISTATGIALGGRQETTLLLGDVTFLHDAGGLLLGAGEAEPQLRIVVLNDSGGAIFGLLEHGAVARRAVTGTPSNASSAPPTQWTSRHSPQRTASGIAGKHDGGTRRCACRSRRRAAASSRCARTGTGSAALHVRIRAAVGAAVAGVLAA